MNQLIQTHFLSGNMKYIITESQLKMIVEQDVPLWLKRRLNAGALKEYIDEAVQLENFSDYDDQFEYADNVIMHAVNNFLTIDEDFFNNESYDEWTERLTDLAKEEYGEELFELFLSNTNDEFDDDEEEY